MADADGAVEGRLIETRGQALKLAFGAAAINAAVDQGGDTRRIVAAILEPLQAVEQQRRRGGAAENADDTAHV